MASIISYGPRRVPGVRAGIGRKQEEYSGQVRLTTSAKASTSAKATADKSVVKKPDALSPHCIAV